MNLFDKEKYKIGQFISRKSDGEKFIIINIYDDKKDYPNEPERMIAILVKTKSDSTFHTRQGITGVIEDSLKSTFELTYK